MFCLITDDTDLRLSNTFHIGSSYRETLHIWRKRFFENIEQVKRLGFDDRFIRTWEYYLCYCEAGFDTALIDDLQLLLVKD